MFGDGRPEAPTYWHQFLHVLTSFLTFGFFAMILSWVMIVLGAALNFSVRSDHGKPKTILGFLEYLLPPEIVKIKSCRIDAVYYVVNRLGFQTLGAPLILGNIFASTLTYQALTATLGPHAQKPAPVLVWVGIGIIAAIAIDFATFYTHYLDHKFAVMWEFHKVHHSAEFLIPITNRRFHPIQELFDNTGEVLVAGILIGTLSYIFSMPIFNDTVIGVDAYYLLNVMSFHHLRHSHVNLSYGPLEAWILSPAQHQLHHSQEARHWDKNFGLFLAVWDRMFGTLLYAEPLGSFRLGLPEAESQGYDSVWQLYATPFINVWKMSQARMRVEGRESPTLTDQRPVSGIEIGKGNTLG
jgi:sterol desaturase/sphingolipid hydroxylase (fatty acid hydroxylase superfamily)